MALKSFLKLNYRDTVKRPWLLIRNWVVQGEPVEVATEWGVFKEIYCAGNEQTFEFLEDVLDYVCEIFPSKYIHIGGDEAPKYRWEHCPKCQQRMKAEGLHDEEALQGWFNTRIENYLATKGKQIIGWDEILEGGLEPECYGTELARF